jgi:hypothetical protein
MTQRDHRILLTQATPGLVLARTVMTQDRIVLCAAGTTLTDAMIVRLMGRGIKRIFVAGDGPPGQRADDYEGSLRALRERFSRLAGNPLMDGVRQAIERALARRV